MLNLNKFKNTFKIKKMKSQKRTQSKSKSKSKVNTSQLDDSDLDRIISDITLKHGRTSYGLFVSDNFDSEKKKDPTAKNFEIWKKLSKKWQKCPQSDKEKYESRSKEEKEKCKKDLEIIKHYFFGDYEKEGSTAYRLFLNSRLKEAFENDEDPKKVKKQASEDWEKMSNEEKYEWKKKKKDNDDWWNRAKSSRNINAYAVFVQKTIEDAKDKNEDIPNFKSCAKIWKKMSEKDKKKYEKFADEMNEERKKMRELFEIANGIQPKKPAGAYKIFLSEKAKEGEFQGKSNVLKEGRKMWEKLSDDEKDEYLKKAKRIRLCYIYKKMLYKKNMKKILPSKPKSSYNFFIQSMKGKSPDKNETFLQMCKKKWNKLSEEEKEKFEDLADKERKKYEKKMEKFQNRVFNLPKRAKTPFQFFIMDKFNNYKEENSDFTTPEILKELAKEWNNLSDKKRESYENKAEKDRLRFKKQNVEFKEFGYYTKTRDQKDEEKEKKSQSQKKRSQRKSQSQKKSAKK